VEAVHERRQDELVSNVRSIGRDRVSDPKEALTELLRHQRRLVDGVSELNNIVTILKGEMDLAVGRAQKRLSEFYDKFPEFKE